MENNELQHAGIKGMKWGVRRYQNKDGTLTPAGKKRYARELAKLKAEKKVLENKRKTQAKYDKLDAMRKEIDDMKSGKKSVDDDAPKKKSVKDMTDEELVYATARLRAEKNYKDAYSALHPQTISRGQKFIEDALNKGSELTLNLSKDYIDKVARDRLGLNKKEEKKTDTSEELRKLVTDLRNKRDAEELKDDEYQNLKRAAAKSQFEKQIRDNENSKKADQKKDDEGQKKEDDAKSETKTETKQEKKTVYEGDVVGEGTSKYDPNESNRGPVVDVDWTNVTVSNVPAVYTRTGRDFIDDYLNKRK